MLIIRPLQSSDLDDLYNMAASAGNGLTTLPPDRHLLKTKIDKAQATFKGQRPPGAGLYLFALEDTEQKLSLIHIIRCRRIERCRTRVSHCR